MKYHVFALASALALSAAHAWADQYYLAPEATDWSVKESYFTDAQRTHPATTVPSDGDDVFAPAGDFRIEAPSASFAVVSRLGRLIAEEGTRLTFAVGGDAPAEIQGRIAASSDLSPRPYPTVIKEGAGTLAFTGTAAGDTCRCHVDVRAGTLKFPQAATVAQAYGQLSVASGAEVWLAGSGSVQIESSFVAIDTAAGSLLTNAAARASGQHLLGVTSADVKSVIRGALGGCIRIWTTGNIDLENAANAMPGTVTVTDNCGFLYSDVPGRRHGVVGVGRFGSVGGDSSLGSRGMFLAYGASGGGFRYLGTEGETTDQAFSFYGGLEYAAGVGAYQAFLDGGPHGGLNYAGRISLGWDENCPPAVRRIWFTGDHTAECVYSGSFNGLLVDNVNYPAHLTKAGTGTWRFADNSSRWHMGGASILDGVLAFDSIAPRGTMCSLGTSTVCTPDDARAIRDGGTVPYAFTLGGADGDPVFEYTGAKEAYCADRPLVLAGKGGHLRASAGRLEFGGISARDANSSPTLVLDGTGTVDNVAYAISDGAAGAHVNVVKDGSGTWKLGGDQTFSGQLTVNAGRLSVEVPHEAPYRPYSWFRLSIAQLGPDANKGNILRIRQLALYDADRNRVNEGLVFVDAAEASEPSHTRTLTAKEIGPGRVGYDASAAGHRVQTVSDNYTELAACFTGKYTEGVCDIRWLTPAGEACKPDKTKKETWIPILMHLTNGTAEVTHLDIQAWDNHANYIPSRFKLEGSFDGVHWAEVFSNIDEAQSVSDRFPAGTGYNYWISYFKSDYAKRPADQPGFATTESGADDVNAFKWFRISIARIYGDGNRLWIRQIGLFDKDGVQQNKGLRSVEAVDLSDTSDHTVVAHDIGVGQIWFDKSAAGHAYQRESTDEGVLDSCCNVSDAGETKKCFFYWKDSNGAACAPNPFNSSTWIPIVMRLPASANPITHIDIQGHQSDATLIPTRLKVEGSVNGRDWTELWNNVSGPDHRVVANQWARWISDGAAYSAKRTAADAAFKLSALEPAVTSYDQLRNLSGVQVAAGATLSATASLPLSFLKVDATSPAGTIEGFSFAETGVLDVAHLPRETYELTGDYAGCTGLANLVNWSVLRDGKPTGRKIRVTDDGRVFVDPSGMVLIMR